MENKTYSEQKRALRKSFDATYELDLKHLAALEREHLAQWARYPAASPEQALDALYAVVPAPQNSDLLHG